MYFSSTIIYSISDNVLHLPQMAEDSIACADQRSQYNKEWKKTCCLASSYDPDLGSVWAWNQAVASLPGVVSCPKQRWLFLLCAEAAPQTKRLAKNKWLQLIHCKSPCKRNTSLVPMLSSKQFPIHVNTQPKRIFFYLGMLGLLVGFIILSLHIFKKYCPFQAIWISHWLLRMVHHDQ